MTDELITHARARCKTCSANWCGAEPFADAQRHAEQLEHHVTGLSQTTLDDDRRAER